MYMIVGSMVSLSNIWRIKSKLRLKHRLFNLKIKDNSQLIILGTSSSINEIPPNTWSELHKATTVGINYFLFNDFVPDIIQLEIREGDHEEYFGNLLKILNFREADFKGSILLIKSNHERSNIEFKKKLAFLKMIPTGLKKNLRFCVDFPVPSTTLKEYKIALRVMNSLGIFNRKDLLFTPHLRASIGLTTVLGIKYNFAEIIYGGIDLNHKKTFYNKKILYKNYGIILNLKTTEGPHLTNDANFSELTIVEVINSLINELKSPAVFSVISNKSALRKIMPHKQF